MNRGEFVEQLGIESAILAGCFGRSSAGGATKGTIGHSQAACQRDRVEFVGFAKRGTYLVICSVNVHFGEGMFGSVGVIKVRFAWLSALGSRVATNCGRIPKPGA